MTSCTYKPLEINQTQVTLGCCRLYSVNVGDYTMTFFDCKVADLLSVCTVWLKMNEYMQIPRRQNTFLHTFMM